MLESTSDKDAWIVQKRPVCSSERQRTVQPRQMADVGRSVPCSVCACLCRESEAKAQQRPPTHSIDSCQRESVRISYSAVVEIYRICVCVTHIRFRNLVFEEPFVLDAVWHGTTSLNVHRAAPLYIAVLLPLALHLAYCAYWENYSNAASLIIVTISCIIQ